MNNTPVNFIGYGHWGKRLSRKVHECGFYIQNLVTDKDLSSIDIDFNNLVKRKDIKNIDWNLPTFISTGPLYHHQLLSMASNKVFVEKPYYLNLDSRREYEYKPYVNYQWYNSLKLQTIKNIILNEIDCVEIDLFSKNIVDRGIEIFVDFFPHVVSILKFLTIDEITSYSVHKNNTNLYKSEFNLKNSKLIFNFGISDYSGIVVKTKNNYINSDSPNKINFNNTIINLKTDPIEESIHRYYKYYLTNTCDNVFISNEFHNLIYNLTFNYSK